MKRLINSTFILLSAIPLSAVAMPLDRYSEDINKIHYIQQQSAMDIAKRATLNQSDMIFTQVCRKNATVNDLRRIENTEEFSTLYSVNKSKQTIGIAKAKVILVTNENYFCKGKP